MNVAPLAWWLSCLWEGGQFWRACRDAGGTQAALLRSLLRRSLESDFGRRHHFSRLRTIDEFRAAVPLSRYDDYAGAIARIRSGEDGVLTQEKVLLLEPTSGSSATPKLIPYTASLRREFQRGVAAWIADLFGHRPGLMAGRHYWSISPPPARAALESAVPIGFADDASYLGSWSARLVRSMLAVPPSVLEQSDYLQATADALTACPNLVFASVWSPTFWLLLLERMPPPVSLRCLSCWGDGYSERYLEVIRQRMPGVWIQKKGLLATEGFCTLPLVGHGAALALRSHFFEFLDAQGRSRLAHELARGERYEIVLTTGGGLYRYRLGDLVELTGWRAECPLLRFLGRADGVVDRFGEKLDPLYVERHLPTGALSFLAFEEGGYLLFGGQPAQALALETALRRDNFHYDHCRRLGQLQELRAFPLPNGALAAFYGRLQALGQRAGDIKPLAIRPEEDWTCWFSGVARDS